MRYLIWLMIVGGLLVILEYQAPVWMDCAAWLFLSWGVMAVTSKLWPLRRRNEALPVEGGMEIR